MAEDDSVFGASCSNRGLPQFVRLFFICCLRTSSTNVDVSHSVLVVFSLVLARCARMSIRHLLLLLTLHRNIPWTSFHLSSSSFFHSLCLGDSVFVWIHPCLTRQGSLDNRSDSFSTFIVVWVCRSSVRCQRCTTRTTSSVTVSLNFLVRCSFANFNSGATICHGVVPHKPSQFAASHASFTYCVVQHLPHTTPFLGIHKTVPVRSWWATHIP